MAHRRSIVVVAALVAAVVAMTALPGCSLFNQLNPPGTTTAPPPVSTAPSSTATSAPAAKGSKGSVVVTTPPSATSKTQPYYADVDPVQAREAVSKGAVMVDIRSEHEFERAHVEGAVNVAVDEFASTVAGWDRKRGVVVYDQTGAGSQSASTYLVRNGFMKVYHVYRGINGWDEPLVGDDPNAIPPQKPILYYFFIHGKDSDPDVVTDTEAIIQQSDDFAGDLQDEFDSRYVYRPFNVAEDKGSDQFVDFGGTSVPMFRIVNERGRDEQFTGLENLVTVRAHLQRAILNYESSVK